MGSCQNVDLSAHFCAKITLLALPAGRPGLGAPVRMCTLVSCLTSSVETVQQHRRVAPEPLLWAKARRPCPVLRGPAPTGPRSRGRPAVEVWGGQGPSPHSRKTLGRIHSEEVGQGILSSSSNMGGGCCLPRSSCKEQAPEEEEGWRAKILPSRKEPPQAGLAALGDKGAHCWRPSSTCGIRELIPKIPFLIVHGGGALGPCSLSTPLCLILTAAPPVSLSPRRPWPAIWSHSFWSLRAHFPPVPLGQPWPLGRPAWPVWPHAFHGGPPGAGPAGCCEVGPAGSPASPGPLPSSLAFVELFLQTRSSASSSHGAFLCAPRGPTS